MAFLFLKTKDKNVNQKEHQKHLINNIKAKQISTPGLRVMRNHITLPETNTRKQACCLKA